MMSYFNLHCSTQGVWPVLRYSKKEPEGSQVDHHWVSLILLSRYKQTCSQTRAMRIVLSVSCNGCIPRPAVVVNNRYKFRHLFFVRQLSRILVSEINRRSQRRGDSHNDPGQDWFGQINAHLLAVSCRVEFSDEKSCWNSSLLSLAEIAPPRRR